MPQLSEDKTPESQWEVSALQAVGSHLRTGFESAARTPDRPGLEGAGADLCRTLKQLTSRALPLGYSTAVQLRILKVVYEFSASPEAPTLEVSQGHRTPAGVLQAILTELESQESASTSQGGKGSLLPTNPCKVVS